jgi:hypothetical protein
MLKLFSTAGSYFITSTVQDDLQRFCFEDKKQISGDVGGTVSDDTFGPMHLNDPEYDYSAAAKGEPNNDDNVTFGSEGEGEDEGNDEGGESKGKSNDEYTDPYTTGSGSDIDNIDHRDDYFSDSDQEEEARDSLSPPRRSRVRDAPGSGNPSSRRRARVISYDSTEEEEEEEEEEVVEDKAEEEAEDKEDEPHVTRSKTRSATQ